MKGSLSVMTEINSAFQNDRMAHSDTDWSSALSSTVIIHYKFVGFMGVFLCHYTNLLLLFFWTWKNAGVSLHVLMPGVQ